MAHPGKYIIQFLHHHIYHLPGRASACISGRSKRGSITIQMALTIPIYFLAIVCLLYFMEMMAIRTSIRTGMQYAGKYAAEKIAENPFFSSTAIKEKIIESIGRERLERSIVDGNIQGIECEESYISASTGTIMLRVKYRLCLPFPVFAVPPVTFREEMKIKGWCGYSKGFYNENEEIVYVAETGMVYHQNFRCTYLDLSIQMVQRSETESLRNESQGKYYPCEKCAGAGISQQVYITRTGDRYHGSLNCSGLKRTVYTVLKSEAAGKGACSRCVSD